MPLIVYLTPAPGLLNVSVTDLQSPSFLIRRYKMNRSTIKLFSALCGFALLPAVAFGYSPDSVRNSTTPNRTVAAYGVTWLEPGRYADSDSLMAICAPPRRSEVKKAAPRKAAPKRVASKPVYMATPKAVSPRPAKPRPKKKVAKATPTLAEQPVMLCPQIDLGPQMVSNLDADESIIPMPGDFVSPEVNMVPLVDPRAVPLYEITPVTTPSGRGGIPLGWLVGGGGGIFTWFANGGGGDDPKTPGNPNIPEIPVGPPITTTPEPGTLILLGSGVAALAGVARRRNKNKDEE